MRKYVLVAGDDWEGLYIDGHLYHEHHSINAHDIIVEHLDGEIQWLTPDQCKALEQTGRLPDELENLEKHLVIEDEDLEPL